MRYDDGGSGGVVVYMVQMVITVPAVADQHTTPWHMGQVARLRSHTSMQCTW